MNRKALGLALTMAIVGAFLLFLYQRRFELEASGGERVAVLQLAKDVERGGELKEEMLQTRRVPLAYLEERSVKANEIKKVVGLTVTHKVGAQSTLMWTDIVTSGTDRRDLSRQIAPGNRGVTIRVSRERTSVSLIRPGDYVDVIGVLGNRADTEGKKTAAVLLQRVLVLAVGDNTSADRVDPKAQVSSARDDVLTLSLSLQEAQLIELAGERGRVAVELRRFDDSQTIQRLPDLSELLTPTARPQGGPHGGATGPVDISGGTRR